MMHERQAHLAVATMRTPNRYCLKCNKLEPIATGHARGMDLQRPRRRATRSLELESVIEHIDAEAVRRSMSACTSTGGVAVVAVPQHPALCSRSDDLARHKRRYRRAPVMMLDRLLVQYKGSNSAVDREFEVSPFVNRPFLAVLRAEVRWTPRRLRWPFGGGRVVVAQVV